MSLLSTLKVFFLRVSWILKKIVKSLIMDSNEYLHRVNGVPLYYNGLTPFLHHQASPFYEYQTLSPPNASPPYTQYDFLMSKITSRNSPLTLTPPNSPLPAGLVVNDQQSRRSSVIMKVENCKIVPAIEVNGDQQLHVCHWNGNTENCYR